jgi:hypothetical protein
MRAWPLIPLRGATAHFLANRAVFEQTVESLHDAISITPRRLRVIGVPDWRRHPGSAALPRSVGQPLRRSEMRVRGGPSLPMIASSSVRYVRWIALIEAPCGRRLGDVSGGGGGECDGSPQPLQDGWRIIRR